MKCVMNGAINYVLVSLRPSMAVCLVPKLGTDLFEFIETICANSGREGAVTG